jgi:hypothetical protein
MLVRYRPGVVGETARTVHLIPLPVNGWTGAGNALCGALLHPQEIETVNPGQGMPCTACLITHVTATPPPSPDTSPPPAVTIGVGTDPMTAAATYRSWGWPVTLCRDEVWLNLELDTVGLIIPALLAAEVTSILAGRSCPPPVLAHPDAPAHRVLLCSQRHPAAPWPSGIQRMTGTLLLPPTVTPRGPLTWVHPPQPDELWHCREIDVFAALHTALTGQPPLDPPTSH